VYRSGEVSSDADLTRSLIVLYQFNNISEYIQGHEIRIVCMLFWMW